MPDSTLWPQSFIDVLVGETPELMDVAGVNAVIDRPLDQTDANGSCGLYVMSWQPPPDAFEIGVNFPTRGNYMYALDFLSKGIDRASARTEMAVVTKRLRTMLYHDEQLQVRLKMLSESSAGVTENYSRMRVIKQDYEMGKLGDTHLAASTTIITVTTENI